MASATRCRSIRWRLTTSGYVTRFPSVVLGTLSPQSQSFTTSGAMVPAETSPANLFRRLFLRGTPEEVEREAQSLNDGGSILDRLKSQTTALRRRVSAADQRKLDAYFDAVRAAEQELTEVQAWLDRPKPAVDAEPPNRQSRIPPTSSAASGCCSA